MVTVFELIRSEQFAQAFLLAREHQQEISVKKWRKGIKSLANNSLCRAVSLLAKRARKIELSPEEVSPLVVCLMHHPCNRRLFKGKNPPAISLIRKVAKMTAKK